MKANCIVTILIILVIVAVVGVGGAVLLLSDDWFDILLPVVAVAVVGLVASCVSNLFSIIDWWTGHQMRQVELSRARLDLLLVQPRADGMLPVPRDLLAGGAFTQQALMLAAQHIANQAPLQPVPHSISYAPHVLGKNDVAPMLLEDKAAMVPAKSFLELFNAGMLPPDKFLMGFDIADGQAVYANWKQLYSALIGGQSGSGKSTLIRSVLAQSALQGGRFVVLDKHYGAGDESLGQSLSPLRSLMLCDVASTEAQMIDALHYVNDIGARRLAGQDADKTPVILIVDETTALLSRGGIKEELSEVLGMIAQETRKVGVYAMCIGQQFKSDIMDTGVRNSFVSMLSCRARKDVARVMSGSLEFAKITESLTIGQAVWMQPDGNVTKIAVPNCTQEMIDVVAKSIPGNFPTQPNALLVVEPGHKSVHGSVIDDDDDAFEPSDSEPTLLSDRAARVKHMFKNGTTQSQIIAEVWQIKDKGKMWQKASLELNDILRSLIPN